MNLQYLFIFLISLLIVKNIMLAPWVRKVPVSSSPLTYETILQSQTWKEVSPRVQSDKSYALLYFGFMNCPDICPTALQNLSRALKEVDPSLLNKINIYFISVDPERDLWPMPLEYAQSFSPSFSSLQLQEEQRNLLLKELGVYAEKVSIKDSALDYTIDHTSRFYLIHNEGAVKQFFTDHVSSKEITEALKNL
jgi:protein SCO1